MRRSSSRPALPIYAVIGIIVLAIVLLIGLMAWQMMGTNTVSYSPSPNVPSTGNSNIFTPPPEAYEPEPTATSTVNEDVLPIEIVENPEGEEGGTATTTATTSMAYKALANYVTVTEGCGPNFEGECVNVRSGPGTQFPVVARLRTGMVLRSGGAIDVEGRTWIRISFNEPLRFPERLTTDWYVAADFVEPVFDDGDKALPPGKREVTDTAKRIIVDRSEQKLYAYEGDKLYLETKISTGLELTPTPRGEFAIFWKTPSRYMQGPTPGSDQVYDLPGVPWNLYFTEDGAVIHGAYWHANFGRPWSHGCVNLPLGVDRKLYLWADLGTKVIVQE